MLLRNIDVLWAEEVLRDRGGDLKKEQARALTLLATGGDKKAADRAWLEACKREVFKDYDG